MKTRLDVLMVERGLAESREKAKAIIMAGEVFVDGQREDKAGTSFPEKVVIEVKGSPLKYVSRGGLKLEKAMTHFDVTLEGKVCMDVGASTGGFTDCMLQNGAKKVYAVDVGNGQLAWKLRQSCCKGYRMFFRNSYIKETLRVDVFKTFQARAIRHSRRNCHNLLISLSQFYHTGRKHILIIGFLPFIFRKSCLNIKWFCSVESGRMPLRRYKSFSFLSKHMDKHSAFDTLCFLQNFL